MRKGLRRLTVAGAHRQYVRDLEAVARTYCQRLTTAQETEFIAGLLAELDRLHNELVKNKTSKHELVKLGLERQLVRNLLAKLR